LTAVTILLCVRPVLTANGYYERAGSRQTLQNSLVFSRWQKEKIWLTSHERTLLISSMQWDRTVWFG